VRRLVRCWLRGFCAIRPEGPGEGIDRPPGHGVVAADLDAAQAGGRRLTDRLGGKYVLMAGLAVYAVGIAGVAAVASTRATSLTFAPVLLVAGLGMGAIFAPLLAMAVRAAPPPLAGAASGSGTGLPAGPSGRRGWMTREVRDDQDGGAVQDDPAELQNRLADATDRLLATAARLTDSEAREPSLLPGWRRGHVLTHLARNADGLRNLLIWARTGVVTPQYPSQQARDDAIEAGAGRPAAVLLADLRESAAAFRAEAEGMPESAWQVSVHGMRGPEHPAWHTLCRRLSEVEIHHVDLAAGYQAADWPGWFAAQCLELVAAAFGERADVPAARLAVTGTSAGASAGTGAGAGAGQEHRIGTAPASGAGTPQASGAWTPEPRISGPAWLLLAWLTGRSDGEGLTADPPGPLPALPAW
jgi:maleylpyruvate isomerase